MDTNKYTTHRHNNTLILRVLNGMDTHKTHIHTQRARTDTEPNNV